VFGPAASAAVRDFSATSRMQSTLLPLQSRREKMLERPAMSPRFSGQALIMNPLAQQFFVADTPKMEHLDWISAVFQPYTDAVRGFLHRRFMLFSVNPENIYNRKNKAKCWLG